MPPGDSAPGSSKSIEIRVHGRGGQGGVTCAKILASVYAQMGKSVQTFGDYAGERSGSPVRAYTRVDDNLVTNRNKVYEPDHLVVLDPSLLKGDVVTGLKPGGTLLLNTPKGLNGFKDKFLEFELATVDATEIARKHKIGTRSLIIVNTAIAGAFVKLQGLSLDLLGQTYIKLGLKDNLPAAKEAYELVEIRPATIQVAAPEEKGAPAPARAEVAPLTEHFESPPTGLKTGSWSSQRPLYVDRLAPCTAHCPAGNDAIGFVRAVGTDGEAAAAAILSKTNPLPGVCGRICPAPCMDNCNRSAFDGAVNIRGLERWIADHVRVVPEKVEPAEDPKRVAIIGGGPAGLSAAYTVALAGHSATIFDREPELGGAMRTEIPENLLPRVILDSEIEAILDLGVEFHAGEALDGEGIAALTHEYDAVVLALGQAEGKKTLPAGWRLEGEQVHRGDGQGVLFAAGELMGGGDTVAHAIGSGRRAAGLALTSLGQKLDLFDPPNPEQAVKPEEILLDHFEKIPPAPDRLRPAGAVVSTSDEVNLGLETAAESERCFSCGRCTNCDTCLVYCPEGIIRRTPTGGFAANFSYCKGCGICVEECARSAMEMKEI
ncbi:MAG: 2-oxoacid:acceptor oxidoreductase family protein [Planctomycetota bacterium]